MPRHRAPLGARRRDAAGHAGRAQDHASRSRAPAPGRARHPAVPSTTAPAAGPGSAGLLMEWAIGKNYDIYRPDTGKLLLPGSQIWWELHLHAVGEEIRDHAELAVYLYPKGTGAEIPHAPDAVRGHRDCRAVCSTSSPIRSPRRRVSTCCRNPRGSRISSRTCICAARPWRSKPSCPTARRQMLSYVDHFNFQWMTNYIYADDAAPVLPKGHHHSRHRMARQHGGKSEQSRTRINGSAGETARWMKWRMRGST